MRYEEFREFGAALFELNLAYRLAARGLTVMLSSEKPEHGRVPDLYVEFGGNSIAIEAYAPAEATKKYYDQLEQDWQPLRAGFSPAEAAPAQRAESRGRPTGPQRWGVELAAVPQALQRKTHQEGFQRKIDQLAAAPQASLLAVPLVQIVVDPKLLGPYLFGLDTGAYDDSVFERLPPNCAGYLLCLWGDVVDDMGMMTFLPAPGRPVQPTVAAILARAQTMRSDGTGVVQRAEALALLAAHRQELESFGVKSIAIFGSVARNEARPDSDVDVLVEFSVPAGFPELVRLGAYLENILGRRVDLTRPSSLKRRLRDRILQEAVYAA